MKLFTVYDAETGTILRSGMCQEEAFSLQAMRENERVTEGEGDHLTQRVDTVTGELVSLQ